MFYRFVMLFFLMFYAGCQGEHNMDLCSPLFVDNWWEVSSADASAWSGGLAVCIKPSSDGFLYTYDEEGESYKDLEWSCVDENKYKVDSLGTFTAKQTPKGWLIDINYRGIMNDTLTVKACSFDFI